jgi:hypothetical protein
MKTRIAIVLSLATALMALPAAAEVYTVKLANGTEFESRQEPVEVDWDENVVMVLTDVGNWIAVDKSQIADVEIETENQGFGKVIDTHTIALGWAPNDQPAEDPEAALDPTTRLLNFLQAQQENQPDYSVEQFVDPSEAGQGGLPVGGYTGLGDTAFPVRSGGVEASQPEPIDN